MPSVSFTIPGKPVGYVTNNGRFYNTKRKRQYLDYKKYVQSVMPRELRDLVATIDDPVIVSTKAYFESGIHPDPENVHKGIKDAIFYEGKRGDKYTGGSYQAPLYDKREPRVEVTVIW